MEDFLQRGVDLRERARELASDIYWMSNAIESYINHHRLTGGEHED